MLGSHPPFLGERSIGFGSDLVKMMLFANATAVKTMQSMLFAKIRRDLGQAGLSGQIGTGISGLAEF
jgi:hypothetical protein